jgi:hypothetical protein
MLFDALLVGLDDYSTDERGDVGSWIRIACVQGLATFSEILLTMPAAADTLEEYLPATRFHVAAAGILKQGVERLDNVRQQAGEQFYRLLRIPLSGKPTMMPWRLKGETLLKDLLFK